jgi:hypothetical protein
MRRLALVFVVLAIALLFAPPAGARVVPQRSIKGIELQMTVDEVREVAGSPDRVAFVQNPIIGRTRVWRYGKTRVGFDGDGDDAKVINLDTTSRGERLANGIGVGSTRRRVRRRVKNVRCRVEFGVDHCYLGRFVAGRRVTDFRLTDGRVSRIVVGIVID